MTELNNEITINGSIEDIWEALSTIDNLEKYDPTVKSSKALSSSKSGIGARRKVDMKDGKNWFEESCTVWKPHEALTYELSACSFPMQNLKHSYSFEKLDAGQVKVKQLMQYQMKYGWFGQLMDTLMVRKQSDHGIKLFFSGLKQYIERKQRLV